MQTFLIFQTKCTAYCDVEINYLYLEKKNSENKATKYQNFKYQQHIVTHSNTYNGLFYSEYVSDVRYYSEFR